MRTIVAATLMLLAGCGPAPDFVDIHGESHHYPNDKWIVVNYWATWCAPCIKEIPELNELAVAHSDQLVVYGVNWDEPDLEEGMQAAEKMKIEFPVYVQDPHVALGVARPEVLPTTFVFAPGLDLRAEMTGPQTAETILAEIQE